MASKLFRRKPLHVLLEELHGENRLRRILGPITLTSLGVGAIIGTGIFVLTGITAHDKAGPALTLSFVVAGMACLFAAFCYAEFASMVPVAGSAYTYAYATLGELFAWIIGWDLVLEYAVCSATVAHGWSHYFQDFISIFKLHIPKVIGWAPWKLETQTGKIVASGSWIDLPAIAITVILKVTIVIFVIVVGAFYVNPKNWTPFAPFGLTGISFFGKTLFGKSIGGAPVGMLAGAAISFFAYIGFDSVSTHAEEAKKPHRDVPIAIVSSLVICTVLYILVSAVLTGMVPYDQIDKNAPVSQAFKQVGLGWAQFLVSLGALAGITSVLVVMMLSQPRVLLAVARDGLLPPKFFGVVHPKFRTPWKSTILTGFFVATLAAALPLEILAELVNIGTLLAFVIVCSAVLIMRRTHPEADRPFRVPLFPLIPILGVFLCLVLMFSLPPENWLRLFVWLFIGLMIYIFYGRKHSIMEKMTETQAAKVMANPK
jgi:APA family basic amino acid/polyamine antiporter